MPVIPHVYKWPIHGIDTPSQSRNIYRQVIFFNKLTDASNIQT